MRSTPFVQALHLMLVSPSRSRVSQERFFYPGKRYGLTMIHGRAFMETHGSYMGINFSHSHNPHNDSREGWIQFPEGSERLETQGPTAAMWEAAAQQRIDAYFREIDSEPDDDSEA